MAAEDRSPSARRPRRTAAARREQRARAAARAATFLAEGYRSLEVHRGCKVPSFLRRLMRSYVSRLQDCGDQWNSCQHCHPDWRGWHCFHCGPSTDEAFSSVYTSSDDALSATPAEPEHHTAVPAATGLASNRRQEAHTEYVPCVSDGCLATIQDNHLLDAIEVAHVHTEMNIDYTSVQVTQEPIFSEDYQIGSDDKATEVLTGKRQISPQSVPATRTRLSHPSSREDTSEPDTDLEAELAIAELQQCYVILDKGRRHFGSSYALWNALFRDEEGQFTHMIETDMLARQLACLGFEPSHGSFWQVFDEHATGHIRFADFDSFLQNG